MNIRIPEKNTGRCGFWKHTLIEKKKCTQILRGILQKLLRYT